MCTRTSQSRKRLEIHQNRHFSPLVLNALECHQPCHSPRTPSSLPKTEQAPCTPAPQPFPLLPKAIFSSPRTTLDGPKASHRSPRYPIPSLSKPSYDEPKKAESLAPSAALTSVLMISEPLTMLRAVGGASRFVGEGSWWRWDLQG
ncbi:hypothetical protein K458DRAFT_412429 [Lentithecium fluviatile CBS 122367]|uniref:Uncharacterized protein n=1 Tax=Lentithecium fluviatile CBS 122367 TaxID=1168545 RepID=A0A6G1JKM1_9PLEO|nr:hypothetical protein K458DRAFT_412429 [Lentithecium fluviatile CBS 122367]